MPIINDPRKYMIDDDVLDIANNPTDSDTSDIVDNGFSNGMRHLTISADDSRIASFPYARILTAEIHRYYPQFFPSSPIPSKYRLENESIYYLSNLNELIEQLKHDANHSVEKEEYIQSHTIRYVITPAMQILFTKERQLPSKRVLAHKELASRCIAAGTIIFSDDFTNIEFVTPENNDFETSPDSLIWPLTIFSLGLEPFNTQLELAFRLVIGHENILKNEIINGRAYTAVERVPVYETTALNTECIANFWPEEVLQSLRNANAYVQHCFYTSTASEHTNPYQTPPQSPTAERTQRSLEDEPLREKMWNDFLNLTKYVFDVDSDSESTPTSNSDSSWMP